MLDKRLMCAYNVGNRRPKAFIYIISAFGAKVTLFAGESVGF